MRGLPHHTTQVHQTPQNEKALENFLSIVQLFFLFFFFFSLVRRETEPASPPEGMREGEGKEGVRETTCVKYVASVSFLRYFFFLLPSFVLLYFSRFPSSVLFVLTHASIFSPSSFFPQVSIFHSFYSPLQFRFFFFF